MTEFWLAALGLLLLAGAFIVLPAGPRRGLGERSRRADNLDWYRLRRRELAAERAAGAGELLDEAGLRLLEDEVNAPDAADSPAGAPWRRAWLLLPVAALAGALYWRLGAAADVRLTRQLQSLGEHAGEARTRALMEEVAARSAARPDNPHYHAILGSYYMGAGDYGGASAHYRALAELAPGDAGALAMAARAGFLANGQVLDEESRLLAERALQRDPRQRIALGLLGMAAFERRQYRAAIEHWRRLLPQEAPGSPGARLLEDALGSARRALGEEPGAPALDIGAAHVTVRVELPEAHSVPEEAVLFVFAREADSHSSAPVAARRPETAALPVEARLDDASSMAGQRISELERVTVVARVSRDGRPGAGGALFEGRLGPLRPGGGGRAHRLLLAPAKE